MLMPDADVIARVMARYRAQEHLVLAAPHDRIARRRFEDTAYTLCVLMGERTAREAMLAAERYLGRVRPTPQPAKSPTGTSRRR
ncbi:DUF5133 domain-containing protein [Streptomyces sp. NPDC019443]|uniref:DUF5133 domain-containing protein n=1 Tax=Streptomyces sp. NPDC019443 TaxID=3365061 RepID=UPI0037BBCE4C